MTITWACSEEAALLAEGGIAIYGLCDPETSEIRYVGQTKNPTQRLRAHLSMRDRRTNPWKARWIAGLLQKSQEPEMWIIGVVPKEEASEHEMMAIRESWKNNHLLNRILPPDLFIV